MAIGPGKYDDVATLAGLMTDARGVVLLVIDGAQGSGLSVQLPPELAASVPAVLRGLADDLDADRQKGIA